MSEPNFDAIAKQAARDEMKIRRRLIKAGYYDLIEKIDDGEIDAATAAQIFNGRRP